MKRENFKRRTSFHWKRIILRKIKKEERGRERERKKKQHRSAEAVVGIISLRK